MPAITADIVELELRARDQAYLASIARTEQQFNRRMELMASSASAMERRVTASANRMSSFLGRAIAAIAVTAAVKDARELADAWTASGNKLAAAGVEMEKVNSTQQRLANLARETRSEFASTADLYAKLTRSTQDLAASEQQVARATETINKAFKAGGASTQEQVSSILQLSQALGSGLLQGDELRSIRENAPLLARAIATEFDTTVAGLKKLGAEGKLTSDRVFKAILEGSQKIDQQFAKTRGTIGEAFTALRTEAGRFLNEFDRATGATVGISKFVNKVADDFDLLAQAVVVSSAVVGAALGVRLTRSLGQAAVQNNEFVKSIMTGKFAFDEAAFAAKRQAGEVLRAARADQEAARTVVVNSRDKIRALEQEAAVIRQNIALAEAQQRSAATQAVTGRNASGQFVNTASADRQRAQAVNLMAAGRQDLAKVTRLAALAEAEYATSVNAYTAAATRATIAQTAMNAATASSGIVLRGATLAMRGLSAAMSFFGGPIGVAIIAIAGALTYFATEASKAEAAGENAQTILDELQSTASQTKPEVDKLSKSLTDNKTAADKSAEGARNAASAYNTAATSAANAAEMIKYMTAAQRQAQLAKVDDALGDLDKSIGGFNPIGTNNEEAVANARKKILRQFGVSGTAARFGSSDVFVSQARDAVKAGTATKDLATAVQDYDNALAVLNDNSRRRAQLAAAREVIYKGIDDPTLKPPKIDTSNLVPPGVDPKKTGGGNSRDKTKTPEELARMREEIDLQQRINVARNSGSEELADFLQDIADTRSLTKELAEAGVSPEDALNQARAYVQAAAAARDLAKEQQNREDAEREAAKAREDEQERLEDLRRKNLFLQEQDLQVQLEIARASGNSERVKELQNTLDLLQRIREYEDIGGLTSENARQQATQDQLAVERAEISGNVRDAFKDGIRAAFDGDLDSFLENFFTSILNRANDNMVDHLFDALEGFDWGSMFGGKNSGLGGLFSTIASSIFGGARAGGGGMSPGKIYKVGENGPEFVSVGSPSKTIPNSGYRAMTSGGGGSINQYITLDTRGAVIFEQAWEKMRLYVDKVSSQRAATAAVVGGSLAQKDIYRKQDRRMP